LKKANEAPNCFASVVSIEATPLINHKIDCFNCDNALIDLKLA